MHGPEWYKTGDLGYLDDKGYLIIVDRLKDVIKYKGYILRPQTSEIYFKMLILHSASRSAPPNLRRLSEGTPW